MRTALALAVVSTIAVALPASASAIVRKSQVLPVGGNSPGNFSVSRVEVRRGQHGSLNGVIAVPATTGGPVIVATIKHAPTRHAVAYVFAGSPSVQTTPVNGTWTFPQPVSSLEIAIVPQVLTSNFDGRSFCSYLPHGSIPTSRLTVKYSTGDAIAGLTPVQTAAQALDVTCHRSGGSQLRTAFGH